MSDDRPFNFEAFLGALPVQGPVLSGDWLREKAERIAAEEADREQRDTQDWLAGLRAKADAELAAWAALPCNGVAEQVGNCSDDFAASCHRRDHVMCPRWQVARALEEQRGARRQMRHRLTIAGVPERVLVAAFDREPLETEAIKAIKALRDALGKRPTIVVLSGGVGCGKSCAAAWWLGQHGGDWISAGDLSKISPYEGGGTERLRSARLVLDDLGVEYLDAKGFLQATLDGVIDHRYANMLPTVITTNLSAAEFKARYGKRVEDRIREAGAFVVITSPSLRVRS
jgi:DNA replication protein DnaC